MVEASVKDLLFILDQLSNAEDCSDEELTDHIAEQTGIDYVVIDRIVSFERPYFSKNTVKLNVGTQRIMPYFTLDNYIPLTGKLLVNVEDVDSPDGKIIALKGDIVRTLPDEILEGVTCVETIDGRVSFPVEKGEVEFDDSLENHHA